MGAGGGAIAKCLRRYKEMSDSSMQVGERSGGNVRRDFSELIPSRNLALIFSGSFSGNGGMFEYGRAWLDQLHDSGWSVSVIASTAVLGALGEAGGHSIDRSVEGGGLSYRRIAISSIFGVGDAKRLLRSIGDGIEIAKVQGIHIIDRSLYTAFLLRGLRERFPRLTIIVTVHDPVWHDEKIGAIARFLKAKDDLGIVEQADAPDTWIHVHSLALIRDSIFARVHHILAVAHPAPRARVVRSRRPIDALSENATTSRIRIGFVGRIEPYKGLDILLRAIMLCEAARPEIANRIEVQIAGRGSIDDAILTAISSQLTIRNEFIADSEFHQIVADLDLLVLPYRSATQSGVGMLGLTYGIPMIVTNVGALSSLVVHGVTGYVMESAAAPELAEFLMRVLDRPEILSEMRRSIVG